MTSSPIPAWERVDPTRWWRRGWAVLAVVLLAAVWWAHQLDPGAIADLDGNESPHPSQRFGQSKPPQVAPSLAEPDAGASTLLQAAELLVPRLSALDPIERVVSLREWEAALAVPVRWGSSRDLAAASDVQRGRLLSGQSIQLERPYRVLQFVSREGKAASDGDLLVIGPLPAAGRGAAVHNAAGPGSALSPWLLLGLGALFGGLLTTAAGVAHRRHCTRADEGRPLAVERVLPTRVPDRLVWPAGLGAEPPAIAPVARSGIGLGSAPTAPLGIPAELASLLGGNSPGRASDPPDGDGVGDAVGAMAPVEIGDLAALLRHEVDRLRRRYTEPRDTAEPVGGQHEAGMAPGGLVIDFDPWLEGPVAHQPALMHRAVRHLLRAAAERALQHVVLSARIEAESWVVIEVDDDGPDASSGEGAGAASCADTPSDLAFVHSVAQWHGGRTSVERSPLGGTRCILRWPVAQGGIPETATAAPDSGRGSPSGLRDGDRRQRQDRRRDDRRR